MIDVLIVAILIVLVNLFICAHKNKELSLELKKQADITNKNYELYMMCIQWIKAKNEKKSISEYLVECGYNRIAIYGMSFVGEALCHELSESDIEISYGIDKGIKGKRGSIMVIDPKDELADVDAIVVTPITYYDEIASVLCQKVSCPILSLEDILYEI